MGDSILCRLGFHKWQDYGKEVDVLEEEPNLIKNSPGVAAGKFDIRWGTSARPTRTDIATHTKVVHEGKQCKRCGIKLRRKLVTNSDGTLSSVDWKPDTEESDKE
ncbi:MAG TPA: hypothetical protein VK487_04780 [Candidatus Bathyarchaeia archaeon]|nr:hypothetical protein [Candidatus Bathyarchaeia archaeon]